MSAQRNPITPVVSLIEWRAWDRLRLAIEAYLAEPSPANLAARQAASREFVAVCGG